jgi:hypothetical protein
MSNILDMKGQQMNSRSGDDMQALLDQMRASSGITEFEARKALAAVISYMASRLPSPVMGRIRVALRQNHDEKELGNAHE